VSRQSVYAGSFDPWSFGHSFVLDSALDIFDTVHICVAVNPSKTGILSPSRRSFLIAKSLAPFHPFAEDQSGYDLSSRVTVSYTFGLVSDFAKDHGVTTLLRGLRSTSDFEAEFNLYFSNYAISPEIKTWTVLCPPELLHCSSTYVRTVVGQANVSTVGTGFLAQCLLLDRPTLLGECFDVILSTLTLHGSGPNRSILGAPNPWARKLQQAFSSILTAVTSDELVALQLPSAVLFQKAAHVCLSSSPDPFDLDTMAAEAIFSSFHECFVCFFGPLRQRTLPKQTQDLLQDVLDNSSLAGYKRALESR
jgi:pantetheine-phosphate adenylyltransferase